MELKIDERTNKFVLKKVFNPIILVSTDNEKMSICMRDSGFEFMYNKDLYEVKEGKVTKVGDNEK